MRATTFTLALLPALAACGATDTGEAAPPPIDALSEPAAEGAVAPVAMPESPIAWGRYKGPNTCLELFANGDAHLNATSEGPKMQAIGALRMGEADGDGFVPAKFEVRRIWKARWVSRCRKNHETGSFTESMWTLGHEFVEGSHDLRVRQLDDGGVELCSKSCETLARQPTVLHGQWRMPELRGGEATFAAEAGQPLELKLREGNMSGLWFSLGPERHWAMLTGSAEISMVEGQADLFNVSVEANMVDTGSGVTADPDSEWHKGSRVELSVERLPQEKLRVCRLGEAAKAEGVCAVLDRRFDAYDYAVH